MPPVSATPVDGGGAKISVNVQKFETTLMVYSGVWGKLMHKKIEKSKISWHCPFKRLALQALLYSTTISLPETYIRYKKKFAIKCIICVFESG